MKQKILPVIAIIIGAIAFLLTQQYNKIKDAQRDKMITDFRLLTRPVQVVAAKAILPRGHKISTQDDLRMKEVARALLTDRVVEWKQRGELEGKKTVVEVGEGDMVMWPDVEGGDSGSAGLAPTIQHGLRAISLNISGAAAVSGMVEPGNHVDVLGTFQMPSKTVPTEMEAVTLTVLQDVTVLATGQTLAKDRSLDARKGRQVAAGYSTVTLEVTPREAEVLVFAQQLRGSLSFSLRNPSDRGFEKDLPEVNFEQIEKKLPELNLFRQQQILHKQNVK